MTAEERAKAIVAPYLAYGASKFDALLTHDIEQALKQARVEALEEAGVKINERMNLESHSERAIGMYRALEIVYALKESEMDNELNKLLDIYVELNKLHASPGQQCHMLADSINFIQRQISTLLKKRSSS